MGVALKVELMSLQNPDLPKSFLIFRNYSSKWLLQDCVAGVTVGLVALPLAMAFAQRCRI